MQALRYFTLALLFFSSVIGSQAHADACNNQLQPNPFQTWLHYRRIGPKSFVVAGQTYTDLRLLGSGEEGTVYLANDGDQQVAIKVFNANETWSYRLHQLEKYKRWLPQVLDTEPSTRTVVMEYRAGIPISTLYGQWKNLGLTAEQFDDIWIRFNRWVGLQKRGFNIFNKPTFLPQNVVYSFDEQTFYLIDPI